MLKFLSDLPSTPLAERTAAEVSLGLLRRLQQPDINVDWCPMGCVSHRIMVRAWQALAVALARFTRLHDPEFVALRDTIDSCIWSEVARSSPASARVFMDLVVALWCCRHPQRIESHLLPYVLHGSRMLFGDLMIMNAGLLEKLISTSKLRPLRSQHAGSLSSTPTTLSSHQTLCTKWPRLPLDGWALLRSQCV